MFKITSLGRLLAAAMLLAACDAATGAQSWTTHQDPLGFSIEIPED